MNGAQIKKLNETIEGSTSIEQLARIMANEQYQYWYDPCGKSGLEFSSRLTPASIRALRRMGELLGLEK